MESLTVNYRPLRTRLLGGGAKGALAPPPHFLGKKQGGQKPHTQKKKRSKSDNHEARYRLKRTTKHNN